MSKDERSLIEMHGEPAPKLRIARAAFRYKDLIISTYNKDGEEKPAPIHALIRSRFEEEVTKQYGITNGQAQEIGNMGEGFIDSEGNFRQRGEAARIALAAGQLARPVTDLYSEDIRDEKYPS